MKKAIIFLFITCFFLVIGSFFGNKTNAGTCYYYYTSYSITCNVCGSRVSSCLFNSEPGEGGDCSTGICKVCGQTTGGCFY